MVESGVKSLSKPVLDKLEPKLGQLDDFACRQLDKVNKTHPHAHTGHHFSCSCYCSSSCMQRETTWHHLTTNACVLYALNMWIRQRGGEQGYANT